MRHMSERASGILAAIILLVSFAALAWLFHGCTVVRDDRRRAEMCERFCYGQKYNVRYMAPNPNYPTWLCRCQDYREMIIAPFQ